MARKEILKMVIGFRKFREKFFDSNNPLFEKLSTGQTPKTLIIACSDSRVDPALMTDANPGDLFVVRQACSSGPGKRRRDGEGVRLAPFFAPLTRGEASPASGGLSFAFENSLPALKPTPRSPLAHAPLVRGATGTTG